MTTHLNQSLKDFLLDIFFFFFFCQGIQLFQKRKKIALEFFICSMAVTFQKISVIFYLLLLYWKKFKVSAILPVWWRHIVLEFNFYRLSPLYNADLQDV